MVVVETCKHMEVVETVMAVEVTYKHMVVVETGKEEVETCTHMVVEVMVKAVVVTCIHKVVVVKNICRDQPRLPCCLKQPKWTMPPTFVAKDHP